jgi:opacity protein-like surface antigen
MRHVVMTAAAVLALVPSLAAAQYYQPYRNPYAPQQQQQPRSGSSYDYQSGNAYRWRQDSLGNTTVNGYNSRTGSTWNSTIQPNGNQRGTDSNGNMWQYNSRTGSYMSTDGTVCIGKGALRTCN